MRVMGEYRDVQRKVFHPSNVPIQRILMFSNTNYDLIELVHTVCKGTCINECTKVQNPCYKDATVAPNLVVYEINMSTQTHTHTHRHTIRLL